MPAGFGLPHAEGLVHEAVARFALGSLPGWADAVVLRSDPQGVVGPAEFDPAEFDPAEFGPAEFDPAEFGQAGFDQAGFDQAGFDRAGFDRAEFDRAAGRFDWLPGSRFQVS